MRLLIFAILATVCLFLTHTAEADRADLVQPPTIVKQALIPVQSCSKELSQFNVLIKNAAQELCQKSDNDIEEARSGCCSHHGGVCGCAGDRAMCCDGAPSPSCGC